MPSLDGHSQEVSDSMHYVLSAPPGMPSTHQAAQVRMCQGASFSLRLYMVTELMNLWKMVPMAMGLIIPPYFLAIGIS